MKTVVENVRKTKMVTVDAGFEEKVWYEANDGKRFDSMIEAEKYEKAMEYDKKWKAIEKIDCKWNYVGPVIDTWYRPKTQEELDMVLTDCFRLGKGDLHIYCLTENRKDVYNGLRIGEWIGYEIVDNGDYSPTYNVYSMEYVRKDVDDYWKMIDGGIGIWDGKNEKGW